MQLIKYDAACRALAEAKTVDEVKDFRDKGKAIEAYAKQANNRDLQADAAEIILKAERRLGQLLAKMPKNKGAKGSIVTGSKRVPVKDEAPTLKDMGVDKKLSARSQKIAKIQDEDFDKIVKSAREKITTPKNIHVANNSGVNEWYTPKEYLDLARAVMGGIDLDPASSDAAQKAVQAGQYFTAENSGLDHEWEGRVWMNPPYSSALVKEFSRKICHSAKVTQAMILVNNATETDWFQAMTARAEAVLFPSKRIKFIDVDGNPSGAPLQGQALIYFGKNKDKFIQFSKKYGTVMCVESALSHYGIKAGTSQGLAV